MQEIYVENIKEVFRNKKNIEKELKIKLTNKGKDFFVKGNPENEYLALKVLEAVNLGFSVSKALQLKDENVILQALNIKDITKKHDLERIRARIIGTGGKTLKTLQHLTECDLSISNNQIGIIGDAEEVEYAVQALTSLIHGSKQGNVYARLERHRKDTRMNKFRIFE